MAKRKLSQSPDKKTPQNVESNKYTTNASTATCKQYIPLELQNAIFCGHLVTDLDSIAGAIGAAELYGGIPARASELNSETLFALEYWKVEKIPQPIEELVVQEEHSSRGICLVDHQQMSQLNKAIDVGRIVGVIDHHALQNSTIITDFPIYMDIRPWGSMSTIITHSFLTYQKPIQKSTAGLLLCAILSDTLNLMGPTTTDWDRDMVKILISLAEVENIETLVTAQFKAKSSGLAVLTASELCHLDQKTFSFKTPHFDGSIGFAVIETTDEEVILKRQDELLMTLKQEKEKMKLDILFLAVVNIVTIHTTLLCCSHTEISLAKNAWPEYTTNLTQKISPSTTPNPITTSAVTDSSATATTGESTSLTTSAVTATMDLGCLVSRKKDFIPAVSTAITKHMWSLDKEKQS